MAVHAPPFFLSRRLALPWALACLAPLTLSAELTWRQPVHTETLAPGVDSAEVRFAFKNTGTTTIKISELSSSCGCTTARSDLKSVAPGAEGVVTVNFQARGSLGLRTGTVTVATDEPDREPYPLTLNLTFTDWVSLTPRLVRWTLNTAPTPQRVLIHPPAAASVELLRVSSANPVFAVRLIAAEGTEPAAIEITPRDTTAATRAVITLTLRPAGQTEINRTLYAQIR